MISKRFLGQLPLLMSFLTTAAVLIWANRGGGGRLLAACVGLSGLFVGLLALYGPRGSVSDWPFWGPTTVVILTVFCTALAVRLLPSQGLWLLLSVMLATIIAAAVYVGANVLLMILFPGRFWI